MKGLVGDDNKRAKMEFVIPLVWYSKPRSSRNGSHCSARPSQVPSAVASISRSEAHRFARSNHGLPASVSARQTRAQADVRLVCMEQFTYFQSTQGIVFRNPTRFPFSRFHISVGDVSKSRTTANIHERLSARVSVGWCPPTLARDS